jgi:hypothetical protein
MTKDMQAVAQAIRSQLPDVHFMLTDYDFGMSVRRGEKAIILFRPSREDHDVAITTTLDDVPAVVRALSH